MAYFFDSEYKSIELHYWLPDRLHTMDAFVQNQCEYEFLNLIKEIARTLGTEISIKTEPLAEGGLRRIYKVISRAEGKKALITTAVITAVATAVIVNPISTTINKVVDMAIEQVFEDRGSKELLDQKTRLEIEKLKQDIKIDSIRLSDNNQIKLHRSNFYLQLANYADVEKVSLVLEDEEHNRIAEEEFIERVRFTDFEYSEDINIVPEYRVLRKPLREVEIDSEVKGATIEIISPDFSTKSNKWKGLYNGKLITFKVTSDEFNKLVQSGTAQFKKGTTITCSLIESKVGSRTTYNVFTVSKY